jgi:PadR family transcriptional regulator, regulatory protein PadR
MKLRKSTQTVRLLSEFLQTPQDWKYGYDIGRNTGLKSGTLYPILIRLAELKLLETRWEASEAGKPPRHMYRLTTGGLRYAREQAPSVSRLSKHRVGQPAFSGVKM